MTNRAYSKPIERKYGQVAVVMRDENRILNILPSYDPLILGSERSGIVINNASKRITDLTNPSQHIHYFAKDSHLFFDAQGNIGPINYINDLHIIDFDDARVRMKFGTTIPGSFKLIPGEEVGVTLDSLEAEVA